MKHIQSFAWHGRNPDNYAFRFFAVWLFLMINDRARSVWEFFGAYAEYFAQLVFMCGACFCSPCHILLPFHRQKAVLLILCQKYFAATAIIQMYASVSVGMCV